MEQRGGVTCSPGAASLEAGNETAGGRTWWGAILLLACGHLIGDFYAVLLTPLLQDFREAFAMSVTAATVLVNVGSLSNSTLQPVVGHFLERFDQKRVFAIGLLIATVPLSCIGLAPGPVWLGALLALGGTGVALFHPSGAVLTSRFAGTRRGLAMSVYANGGAIGIALAPLAVTLLLVQGTRQMSWVFMPLGLVATATLVWLLPATRSPTTRAKLPTWRSLIHPDSRSVWLVFASVVLRSLVVAVVTSFIVIYAAENGWSKAQGRFLLTAFLLACAAGGLAGGYVSDYLERRRLMLAACFLGFLPLAAAWQVPFGGSLVLLVVSGAILSLSTPVNIVVAQELRPEQASAMSGLMMGLAWSVSVLLLIPFGTLADLTSTGTALRVSSFLLPIAGLCVLRLPEFPPLVRRTGVADLKGSSPRGSAPG
ncbi:MAG: MFS transporter [Pirellulales bacterium]|nr:MFS transporter [Pirellulales bacterium]